MPLSQQDIESELSYSYIHAIAGKAGISCKAGNRHDDNQGIDAELTYKGPTTHPYLRQIQLNVQLKATTKPSGAYPNHLSYFFNGVERYEKLRTNDSLNYKILVVLFLPPDPQDWLSCSSQELVLKQAAYWVNLYGAPACANLTGETIYLPKNNLFDPSGLITLIDLVVNNNIPAYIKP